MDIKQPTGRSSRFPPWLLERVENHLIFGFLFRWLPAAWILGIVGIAAAITLFLRHAFMGSNLGLTLSVLGAAFVFARAPIQAQAVFAYVATKSILAVCGFAISLAGFGRIRDGMPGGAPLVILGLIWMPSIEFVPKFARYRNYFTLGRIFGSILLLGVVIRDGLLA